MKKGNLLHLSLFALMMLALISCGQEKKTGEKASILKAVAVLHPTQGNSTEGMVTFTRTENGIKVIADVSGLTPGKHGFHIHEYGNCSKADATSAGGHFNPDNKPHGAPTDKERHVGDLGNITADEEGKAHLEWLDPMIAFEGKHSIIGRAVVVHASEDDLKSQPTGNAGPRVACGVIGVANKEE